MTDAGGQSVTSTAAMLTIADTSAPGSSKIFRKRAEGAIKVVLTNR